MLQNNLEKLSEPWNPTEPINNLWKQVKECHKFAKKEGKEEIPKGQVMQTVINTLYISGIFTMDMHSWINRPETEQESYTNLKEHFSHANRICILKSTAKSAGYTGAATKESPTPTPEKNKNSSTSRDSNQTTTGETQTYCCIAQRRRPQILLHARFQLHPPRQGLHQTMQNPCQNSHSQQHERWQ
jgi:hypothetical protein